VRKGETVILRIRMRDWRSYRDVTVELDRPVVFFVAPNGVGKTSLVEAVRRCLLGFPKPRVAARAVRAGANRAELSVDLIVGGTGTIRITRTVTRTGRTTFTATTADGVMDEEQFRQVLGREWATDVALLDRLVFGDNDPVRRASEPLPVREHLADLLGVTPLLSAVADLRNVKTAVTSTIAGLRTEAASANASLADADAAVSAAQAALDAFDADRTGVRDRLRGAETAAGVAENWDRYRAAANSYNAKVADLLVEVSRLVSVDPADPAASLEQARASVDAELAATRQAAQDGDLTAAKAASASDLLAGADDICPTCLRPLSETERAAALYAHGETAAEATTGSARAREQEARVETHLRAVAEFSRRLDRLQPPTPPGVVDPGPEATIELADAKAADTRLAEQVGEARARLETATTVLEAARRQQREAATLERAARQELLLETTANAFEQIADRYLHERIEPLRHDIEHRWKLVFGKDGLVLDPAKGMRLLHGEITLEPEDMSGGERAIAGVIVRLLVAAAVTRIPTLWFDEPLEHLDPRRRAGVARTLVQAAAAGTVHQVVATTYEEGIARSLAQAAPDLVAVVYADDQARHQPDAR
jgi:DNA repair exonuclease SbcCD ATPase subunit